MKTLNTKSKGKGKRKINLVIYPKMKEFFNATQRFKILLKGRRVGATISAAFFLILQCLKHKNKDYLWIDVDFQHMRTYYEDYFYPKLKLLPKNIWHYNAQTKIIKIRSNTITFKSDSSPESIEGHFYNLIIVNECGFILKSSKLWLQTLRPMLIDKKGGAIFIGTPKYGKGFYHYELVERIKNGTLPPDEWLCMKISTYENPYIEKSEVDMMRNEISEDFVDSEIFGNFPKINKNIFAKSFDYDKHVVDLDMINKHIGLSFDFNVGRMCCLVFGFNNMNINSNTLIGGMQKTIFIYKEFYMKNFHTIKEFCLYLNQWVIQNKYKIVIITGDASGHSRNVNSELTSYSIIQKVFNLNNNRFIVRNKNLEHVISYEICNVMFQNFQIQIDRSCLNLTNELSTIGFEEGKDTLDKSNIEEGHILDCFRYILDNFCYNNSFRAKHK